ncbi:hypothetical protein E3226_007925 [Legionella geestiana]|uniref:hypothetical protein n=1 Tax=Legionella geestiana TaxID=45065 RepID=UPI001093316B|nr:hypothetical protein [Legionella geestiana]QDQ40328.1 hypothetical protein E3226_007925 [Legionella geestiana]
MWKEILANLSQSKKNIPLALLMLLAGFLVGGFAGLLLGPVFSLNVIWRRWQRATSIPGKLFYSLGFLAAPLSGLLTGPLTAIPYLALTFSIAVLINPGHSLRGMFSEVIEAFRSWRKIAYSSSQDLFFTRTFFALGQLFRHGRFHEQAGSRDTYRFHKDARMEESDSEPDAIAASSSVSTETSHRDSDSEAQSEETWVDIIGESLPAVSVSAPSTPRPKPRILAKDIANVELRHTGVYFNSLSAIRVGPKTHGFIASGNPGKMRASDMAKVYAVGRSVMHARFEVTEHICRQARRFSRFPEAFQEAVLSLRGQNYNYVELFLRDVYTRYFNATDDTVLLTRVALLQTCLNEANLNAAASAMLEDITSTTTLSRAISALREEQSDSLSETLHALCDELLVHGTTLQAFTRNLVQHACDRPIDDTLTLAAMVNLPQEIDRLHQALNRVNEAINRISERLDSVDYEHLEAHRAHLEEERASLEAQMAHLQALYAPLQTNPACAQFLKDLHDYLLRDLQTENRWGRTLSSWNSAPMTQMPLEAGCQDNRRDARAFEDNWLGISSRRYAHVSEEALRQSYQQTRLHMLYLEMREGFGKSVTPEEKIRHRTASNREAFHLTEYRYTPSNASAVSANCNKSNATLLQAAALLDARKQGRVAKRVVGSSSFSVGSNQRYSLWNPLRKNYQSGENHPWFDTLLQNLVSVKTTAIPAHLQADLQHISLVELAFHKERLEALTVQEGLQAHLNDPDYLIYHIFQVPASDVRRARDAIEGMSIQHQA